MKPKRKTSYGQKYKVVDGTYYSQNTSDDIIKLLEKLREKRKRVHFRWGDTKTGKDWGETMDVEGTIGRSTGEVKIPLLIAQGRSTGGGGLLTGSIVKIMESKGKKVLYKHPKYHLDKSDKFLIKRLKQMGVDFK